MKIAIISDLHGNYEALRSLPTGYDELWILGDLVNYGPEPAAVVDFARTNSKVVVRGNHDNSIGFDVDPRCTARYQKMADLTRRYTASALDKEHKQFLRLLPLKLELKREDTRFYLCHAKPSDPLYGYCPEESDEWVEELEQVNADVLLVGHTHTPFIRKIGKKIVVNPGSLGQPKTGKPDGCYAIWENGDFQLKSFPYAVDKTVERLKGLAFPPDVEKDLITVLQTGSV
ncbi:MAG TPA: YfcE family phosphodiesterase [Candidatus Acidoferrales bacterium]|nr:YfcE family phosphodiesterase [Candidatus Acidoferrales bacterium]